jgi:hypothetical protein
MNEVFLGLGFQRKANGQYVFKWGGPLTENDIKKRNRDIYEIDGWSIKLINF